MYQIRIQETAKGFSPNDFWTKLSVPEHHSFSDLKEVKEYLKKKYGKCKRVPMYYDDKDGKPIKCGYIYGFRNADLSHYPVVKWLQQDWVSINEIKPVNLN
jgi:hypothetical protein